MPKLLRLAAFLAVTSCSGQDDLKDGFDVQFVSLSTGEAGLQPDAHAVPDRRINDSRFGSADPPHRTLASLPVPPRFPRERGHINAPFGPNEFGTMFPLAQILRTLSEELALANNIDEAAEGVDFVVGQLALPRGGRDYLHVLEFEIEKVVPEGWLRRLASRHRGQVWPDSRTALSFVHYIIPRGEDVYQTIAFGESFSPEDSALLFIFVAKNEKVLLAKSWTAVQSESVHQNALAAAKDTAGRLDPHARVFAHVTSNETFIESFRTTNDELLTFSYIGLSPDAITRLAPHARPRPRAPNAYYGASALFSHSSRDINTLINMTACQSDWKGEPAAHRRRQYPARFPPNDSAWWR